MGSMGSIGSWLSRHRLALEQRAEDAAADPRHVVHHRAVPVLIEENRGEAARAGAVGALAVAGEDVGEAARVEAVAAFGPAQRSHDDRRQDHEQTADLLRVEAGGLAQPLLDPAAILTQDVSQNLGGLAAGRPTLAEEAAKVVEQ